ncbi:hypothetical protein LTR84_007903 [Exophiala bonariae]|uniref:Uncharacterized protein n=1 Tax=Exophiala bonariae TaxID=1690606 RepID=A0AAV9NLE5_9EURO|nr:hypothetical protein LTR84_007903 [Exophiala bonariae]
MTITPPGSTIPNRLSNGFVRQAMGRTGHTFIPSSHKFLHFVGRWTTAANQLRRDAALPGSYLEFVITNTTSLYCELSNISVDDQEINQGKEERILVDRHTDHAILQPASPNQPPSRQVSLLVQVNDNHDYIGYDNAFGMIEIADDLDPSKAYKVKITHLGSPGTDSGTVEFKGIWVDKPLQPGTFEKSSSQHPRTVLRNPFFYCPNGHFVQAKLSCWKTQEKKTIEIVGSETALTAFAANEDDGVMAGRLIAWTEFVRKRLSVDTVLIPTSKLGLLPRESSPETIGSLFFRSGSPSTAHFSRPWSFSSYRPSVLVLQLGLVDFMLFFADKKNHGDRAINKFKAEMKAAIIDLVHNIRKTAYPHDSATNQFESGATGDGGYRYNSAPSTLPIFLITPFTASRRFVTKRQKLDSIISDVLAQAASTLQSEGDKSSFWIDTSGWLESRVDFLVLPNSTSKRSRLDTAMLTPFANFKVASLLEDHLCPHLNLPTANPSETSNNCDFIRYDNYLGDVYIPGNVEFNRALTERKIATLKERFGIMAM